MHQGGGVLPAQEGDCVAVKVEFCTDLLEQAAGLRQH